MPFAINIFEKPELVISVEPGDIIQAVPGATATGREFMGRLINEDPTNVFGYVVGLVHTDISLIISVGSQLKRSMNVGHVVVHRIIPSAKYKAFIDLASWLTSDAGRPIHQWEKPTLLYGKVTSETKLPSEISDMLTEDAVLLSDEELKLARGEISGSNINSVSYRVQTPDGSLYDPVDLKVVSES